MIEVNRLKFSYKTREALRDVNFSVARGEIFGLLGPNGGGKTTLFRILSTYFLPTSGQVSICGQDAVRERRLVRKKLGVVFQSPSLDGKLTVFENLIHQGHLYGLAGSALRSSVKEMLGRLGMEDRSKERVDKLSGGLKRRAELAKGLLHRPEVLILDEPSTGLDPGARIDLWKYLKNLRERENTTILVTTHLMEEAEHCDRLGILSHGQLVATGSPESLKQEIGGDVVIVTADDPTTLSRKIEEKFHVKSILMNGALQIEREKGARFITELVEAFPGMVNSVTFRKPTLEDVFVHRTGHKFWEEEVSS